MEENEISVTFFIDKDVMNEFEKSKKHKETELGIKLTKKQALQIAIKEATENWKQKSPAK